MKQRLLPLLALTVFLVAPLRAETLEGWALPQPGAAFEFPRAHGSHPDFKVEWWYLTGHLRTEAGKRFGYQVTFFRRGLNPGKVGPDDQIYLAHAALTDEQGKAHFHQERIARPGWNAEASTTTLDVRNGPWSLVLESAPGEKERLRVRASVRADVEMDFTLTPSKPLVFFGDDRVSRKGDVPSAASHYLTFTRLATTGVLQVGGERFEIVGDTWMDHEISSSQLDKDQVGWDWFGLQLEDGREVMLYRLRRADGSSHPASRLTWVDRQGRTEVRPFTWTSQRLWESPHTRGRYPVEFSVSTEDPETGRAVTLQLTPLLDAQELHGTVGGISYWEGAAAMTSSDGRLTGRAYVELTGYAEDLKF